ncbi:hypothetical protein [Halegenticoccus tardaugens]|uniref:hypothetical protein n=1 Tax=Halegenticoccus tardaugens TaxID=2071624 RepID=UPI00100B27A9|nr:hypothetical protein [Halegenticoccus tardaugens]
MDRRSLLAAAAFAIAGSSAGCLEKGYDYHPLPPIAGRVVRRGMTAETEGSDSSTSILTVEPEAIGVDPALRSALPREDEAGNVTITPEVEEPLADEYGEVFYHVEVEHENANPMDGVERGDRNWYTTTRNTFNRLMVGDDVRFQVEFVNRPSMAGVSEVVRRGDVASAEAEGDGGGETYRVVVDHGAWGETRRTRAYTATRATFDRIETGQSIRFAVEGEMGDRIDELLGA